MNVSAEQAIYDLLLALGEDPRREGLVETPRRMATMLSDLITPVPFSFTVFDSEGMDSMVAQTNIPWASLCEHHLAPMVGQAYVAYIPNGKIVGLSKLTRAVHYCAKGLQTQERITIAIANMLEDNLLPLGVGVVLKALHSCMSLRGVKVADVVTTTSCLKGVILTEPSARAEFLALIR